MTKTLVLLAICSLVLPADAFSVASVTPIRAGTKVFLRKNHLKTSQSSSSQVMATSIPYHPDTQQAPAILKPDQEVSSLPGVNFEMLTKLLRSQVILLVATTAIATVCTGGDLGHALQWGPAVPATGSFGMHAALGIAATFPMIALSQTVENSSRRDAHYVNFATTNMAVSLFGRREEATNKVKTAQVLGLSFGLVALTAIVEEVVFRGFLSTALYSLSNHNMVFAWLGQATLFGLGHVHPKSRPEENRLVVGLQSTNAAWHGLMVMLTGSLVPGIISHLLYDWHVLASTWHQVNLQMDWTEEHALDDKQLTDRTELSEATRSFLTRFFYAFDKEHTGSLSEPDVQRAVAYAFMLETPPDQETVHEAIQGRERVELDDFVQVLLDLRAKQQQVA